MDATNGPGDISEIHAWKMMMDSMVKFIQASTRLMNTFNDKANSHLSLPSKQCENNFRTLLAPAFSVIESHQKALKKMSNTSKSETESQEKSEEKAENEGKTKKTIKLDTGFADEAMNKNQNEKTEPIPENTDITNEEEAEEESGVDVNNNCNITCEATDEELTLYPEDEKPRANLDTKTDGTCDNSGTYTSFVGNAKADITLLMTMKLEQAQKEIENLKTELSRLQRAKTNKSSELYKEIMKDNAFEKRPNSTYSSKFNPRNDNEQTFISARKVHLPVPPPSRPYSPLECCNKRSIPAASTFRSDYQLGNRSRHVNYKQADPAHRSKPIVCIRRCRPQRRFVQASTDYDQQSLELYNPLNYLRNLPKQVYPICTRPATPDQSKYNSSRPIHREYYLNYQQGDHSSQRGSVLDYICGDQTRQPLYHSYGTNDDGNYVKDDNYLSDDASVEEYLCANDLV